jgi:uncharacterized protein (TIGR02996 family)
MRYNLRVKQQALERAILDDPDALEPRAVYADWLQSEGSPIGEWAAFQHALRERPRDVELRRATHAFYEKHAYELIGTAAEILDGLYLGWHGGFLDEIRIHGSRAMTHARDGAARLRELLAHPIARFVRTLAIGSFAREQLPAHYDSLLEVLTDKPPQLLEALALFDTFEPCRASAEVVAQAVAAAPKLTRLGLGSFSMRDFPWSSLPSSLRELVIRDRDLDDRLSAVELPQLEELVLIKATAPAPIPRAPRLRRLRLVECQPSAFALEAREWAEILERVELLDLSHSTVPNRGELARPGLEILDAGGDYDILDAPNAESWLPVRLERDGRDALKVTPGAGVGLYNVSCRIRDFSVMRRLAATAATFPDRPFHISAWGNTGYASEKLRDHAEAELIGREGLLRDPDNANFYSVLLASLRLSGRVDEAAALVQPALAAITKRTRMAEAVVCLLDVVVTLDQVGKARQALVAVKRKSFVQPDARLHGAIALAMIASGRLDEAGAQVKKSFAIRSEDTNGVSFHAQAALHVARGRTKQALTALAKAVELDYPDWPYLAERDPRFDKLRADPRFAKLCQRAMS